MANTYVITALNSEERLAQFRSTDLPSEHELLEQYGPVGVYDLTDNMRPLGYVVPRMGGGAEWRSFEQPPKWRYMTEDEDREQYGPIENLS